MGVKGIKLKIIKNKVGVKVKKKKRIIFHFLKHPIFKIWISP